MAENKTQKTEASVADFLAGIADDTRRADCQQMVALMEEATGSSAKMWGTSIVGFGHTHLVYESGRELDWFWCGFSPRKSELTLYLMSGYERLTDLLAKLGKHKIGKSCLYVKKLSDLDLPTLKLLIAKSLVQTKELLAAMPKDKAEARARQKAKQTAKPPAAKKPAQKPTKKGAKKVAKKAAPSKSVKKAAKKTSRQAKKSVKKSQK